ncbi:MAG TPA: hypothetical protein VGE16_18235 [Albitalea sp.]
MNHRTLGAVALLGWLAGCAGTHPAPDFAAQHRPLEERCARLQKNQGRPPQPGARQADVQAEARAAASRGELDKACDWL